MTDMLAPYNLANDNIILLLLILDLVGISYVLLMNGANIFERTKCIFYYESKSTPYNDRTHITTICNLLMDFQIVFFATIVITAILDERCFELTQENSMRVISTVAALLTGFFIIKRELHDLINRVLFSKSISEEWDDFYFFTIKLLGFTLLPAVIVVLFIPQIPLKYVEFYSILILLGYLYTIISGLNKIIFAKNRIYLDLFLYLCALEFLPIAMVWKTMLQLEEYLTIKI